MKDQGLYGEILEIEPPSHVEGVELDEGLLPTQNGEAPSDEQ